MTVFYAYVNNIKDDNTVHITIVFASRTVTDKWWCAISTGGNSLLSDNVKRITPQFFTHQASHFNILNFFIDSRLDAITKQFRGYIFLTLENDRGGRGISIIPSQDITDHISGNW
ncbi:hypothetical protein B0H10DRAFT_1776126 [Mycena sp. CBHHK59/15]|nr:hypothetical protein B0H10DRAFT_1776126 [Mycena sp. CBHHK59/15]